MGWQFVKVLAWVEEHDRPPGAGGGPGSPPGIWGGANEPMPTPPIYLPPQGGGGGGAPPGIWPGPGPLPHPEHPIAPGGPPPGIWPGPGPLPHPEHPIAPGGEHPMPPIYNPPVDPGYGVDIGAHPMPPIYYPPEIWPDPGIPTHPIVLPEPPSGAHPEHPIYWPPVIWPDPPTGLPSFDPDQLPQHPELPDLNHGVWYWVENGDALERAFIAQVVRPSIDPPDYQPKLPPEGSHPGNWVICLLSPQRPAWAWIPSDPTPEVPEPPTDAHPEHPIVLPPEEPPHVQPVRR